MRIMKLWSFLFVLLCGACGSSGSGKTPPPPRTDAPPVVVDADRTCAQDDDCTETFVWTWRDHASGYCTGCASQPVNRAGERRLLAWYGAREGHGCPTHDCEPPTRQAGCVQGLCGLVPIPPAPTGDPLDLDETEPPLEPHAKQVSRAPSTPGKAAPGSYPGSRRLCDQRVYGRSDDGPLEIHWTLDASTHAVTRVAEHYRKSGGGPGSLTGGEHTFEFPSGHRVTVLPVSAKGRHPSCGVSPRAGEKTLIRISRALSPKSP